MNHQTPSLSLNIETNRSNIFIASIICLLGAMFYLYEFVIQVSPSVMTHQLMRDLSIDAAGLGMISSAYYYAYTPMQLPAGVLYDRFGPRILITIMIMVCALGACFFGFSQSAWLAGLGRFLMGIGSAFAFVGVAILIARWFPPAYFAFLLGIAQLMSSVGAITGQIALSPLVHTYGWRPTMEVTAAVGLGLAVLVWLVVRDAPKHPATRQQKTVMAHGEGYNFRALMNEKQLWLIALYGFMVWAPILVFASLWGNPFLEQYYGISDNASATCIAVVWLGIGVGSPFIGWFSDHIQKRCLPLAVSALIGVLAGLMVIFFHLPYSVLLIALFFFGFAAGGQTLAFGLAKDIVRPEMVGTAVGFVNLAVVAGGMLLQPLTGFILRLLWNGHMVNGIPEYTAQNYQIALVAVPICYLAAFLIAKILLKETDCKARYPVTIPA